MRKFNFDQFIWFTIQSSLLGLLVFLIQADLIKNFISEKMMIYLNISIFILAVYIVGQLYRIFTIPSRIFITNKFLPLTFVIVLTTSFFYLIPKYKIVFSNVDCENNIEQAFDGKVISDTNFMMLYESDIPYAVGEKIQLTAVVKKVTDKYVIVSRDVINCCQGDRLPLDIKVKVNEEAQFEIGNWVKVVGEIKEDNEEFFIESTNLETTKQPLELYFHQ